MRIRWCKPICRQRLVSWLWGTPYKGLEIAWGGYALWIGYTPREWRERGW